MNKVQTVFQSPGRQVQNEEAKQEFDPELGLVLGSDQNINQYPQELLVEEDLGSELSGLSVEVPEEVVEMHLSANYLTFYARHYKSGLMATRSQHANGAKVVFQSQKSNKNKDERLLQPVDNPKAAA